LHLMRRFLYSEKRTNLLPCLESLSFFPFFPFGLLFLHTLSLSLTKTRQKFSKSFICGRILSWPSALR
jgi:hypothetical protein